MLLRKQTARVSRGWKAPINATIFSPWLRAAAISLLLCPVFGLAAEPGPSLDAPALSGSPRFSATAAAFTIFFDASDDTKQALQWVLQTADNSGLPFAVVDKKTARIFDLKLMDSGAAHRPPCGACRLAMAVWSAWSIDR